MLAGGVAKGLMGFDWGGKRARAAAESKRKYDAQKEIYAGLNTRYSFGEAENQYTGMENQYDNMENTMEDLTVNTQQAEFENQMFQQSQANTMQGLRGAAGSSGVAGLAQAMSNQAMTQSQRVSASIGAQESKNKILAAQQAAQNDQLQRAAAAKNDQLSRAGASQVSQYNITNKATAELNSMQMEQSKQATLLGMSAQAYTGAKSAVTAGQQMMGSGIGDVIGGVASAWTPGEGDEKGSFNFMGNN